MRIRMSLKPVVAAAVSVGALAITSSAMAAAPTGDFVPFKYCPYSNTAVQTCLKNTTTSGSFTLGNATVPITSSTPTVLQGAYSFNNDGSTTFFGAANGGSTLNATPLKVPGGLIGLVSTGGWSGVLIDLFNAAVASVNDVYATAELAGSPQFDYINYLIASGTAFTLPIKVHLTNPFLGSSCYIGSNSNPITLRLTLGTTSPPAPNSPISGSPGDPFTNASGTYRAAPNTRLVDNAFSVPAASNCGYLPLDKLVITAGVNLKEGLPSAAGKNTAILQGTAETGDRAAVAASVH
ncbi:MAG TPA: hypothetical protein VFG42_03905 [Baekduia sp.]|uniref:hypothetical protein n=1 Tax=Baekduia sp. TaxID=2600305 RepID=UPI002D76841C|nr:hypothetical protein [Baekduia sp.]HET6505908.1 hypothetical protein [Baekduia sp.]